MATTEGEVKIKVDLVDLKTEAEFIDNHFNQVSNCEYLVFKLEKGLVSTNFSDEEQKIIYDFIFTHSFPMNTHPICANLIAKLSAAEQHEMDCFEKRYIFKKLQSRIPNLHLLPIPKSLYQLFFVLSDFGVIFDRNPQQFRFCTEMTSTVKAATLKHDQINKEYNFQFEAYLESLRKGETVSTPQLPIKILEELRQIQLLFSPINQDSFYLDCYEFNFSPYVKKTWSMINNALVKEFLLLGTLVPSLKTINALLEKWLRNATQQLDQPLLRTKMVDEDNGSLFMLRDRDHFQANRLLLQHLIGIEYTFSLRYPQKYFIYRGGSSQSDFDRYDTYFKENKNCATSFSDGLLAGFTNDLHTGCAFYYMGDRMSKENVKPCNGYLVAIDKALYRTGKMESQLFFIPPVCNIARITGHNELHHVRSKMSKEKELPPGPGGTSACVGIPFLHNDLPYPEHLKYLQEFLNVNVMQIKTDLTLPKLIKKQIPQPHLLQGFRFKRFLDDQMVLIWKNKYTNKSAVEFRDDQAITCRKIG